MNDTREDDSISGKSVAAFLFLPQFRHCFRGFHHLYPVFMRCLALVFVQSRLIPEDHPAIYHGAPGVQRTSITELFGEAWFTLKTTRATTFQYGMFASIIMMMLALAAAIGTFMLKIFFGLGDMAQAQLFSSPCSPYSGGACAPGGPTDINTLDGAITAPGGLFDSRVNAPGVSADYALMVLDKILRQAATGNNKGGALQNALTDLMQVYNSGVLLVAGAIMFWMVLSIVIDSAKTGLFGGGRHNMVWAPIRIVFALGIMIPLGANGFSSGQYAVMKLAEWGSNFGSQGWDAYVSGVVADDNLLSPFSGNNLGTITTSLIKVMVCQVAHNTYAIQSRISDQDQWILVEQETNPRDMWVTNRYTNKTDSNVCGTVKYGTPTLSALEDKSRIMAHTATTTPADGASAALMTNPNRAMYTNFNAGLSGAIATFRQRMMGALSGPLTETMNITAGTTGGGQVGAGGGGITLARRIACNFVARSFGQSTDATNPIGWLPAPINHCAAPTAPWGTGSTPTPATPMDATDPQALLTLLQDAVTLAYDGNVASTVGGPTAKDALYTYIKDGSAGGMVGNMKRRGWAGMGMWYLDIAQLNSALQAAREPVVTIEAGSLWSGSKGGLIQGAINWTKCVGSYLGLSTCKDDELEEKVTATMGNYEQWWAEITRPGTPGRTAMSTQFREAEMKPSSNQGLKGVLNWLKGLLTGDSNLMDFIVERIWPRADNVFLLNGVDVSATNTYPLAALTNTGHTIMSTALKIFIGVTVVQILFCVEAFGISGGCGLGISAIAQGLATIATTMLVAGMVIAFYLPVLPFIRVAFAVLTWMVSVFEAVVMVPIAAIAHLTTEGDGLTGGSARTAWILWLNVLMRPILVVFGFVGGMLIFNTFAVYFHASFSQGAAAIIGNMNGFMAIIGQVAYTIIYLGTLYTAANSSFKMMDLLPNALMRWMGGSADHSMDDDSDGMMLAATQMMGGLVPRLDMNKGQKKPAKASPGTTPGA